MHLEMTDGISFRDEPTGHYDASSLSLNCGDTTQLVPLQSHLAVLRVSLVTNATPASHLDGLRTLLLRLRVFSWHSFFNDYAFTQGFLNVLRNMVLNGDCCDRLEHLDFKINLLHQEQGTEWLASGAVLPSKAVAVVNNSFPAARRG